MNKITIESILQTNAAAEFVSVTYTATSGRIKPERARYVLGLRFNLDRIYRESLELASKAYLKAESEVEMQAALELVESLQESMEKGIGNNSQYTRQGTTESLSSNFRLVNLKNGTQSLEITGIVLSKKVLEEGEYKPVNSSPKTIAKNKIRRELPISKFRCFRFNPENLHWMRARGKILSIR